MNCSQVNRLKCLKGLETERKCTPAIHGQRISSLWAGKQIWSPRTTKTCKSDQSPLQKQHLYADMKTTEPLRAALNCRMVLLPQKWSTGSYPVSEIRCCHKLWWGTAGMARRQKSNNLGLLLNPASQHLFITWCWCASCTNIVTSAPWDTASQLGKKHPHGKNNTRHSSPWAHTSFSPCFARPHVISYTAKYFKKLQLHRRVGFPKEKSLLKSWCLC